MNIDINWDTQVITIPKSEMTLIQTTPYEIRQLNANDFRLALKNVEDSQEGITFLDTHRHNTEITLGGVTYARSVEIINGYSVTFEDGQYAVNIVGGNTNILDVANLNQVSIRSSNSAGLIVTNGVGGASAPTAAEVATEVWQRLLSTHVDPSTFGGLLNILNTRTQNIYNSCIGIDLKLDINTAKCNDILLDTSDIITSLQTCIDLVNNLLKYSSNRTKIDESNKTLTIYDDDGVTPIKIFNLRDFNGLSSITQIAERIPQ